MKKDLNICECGSVPYLDRTPLGKDIYWVQCNCGIRAKSSINKQRAIYNWNSQEKLIGEALAILSKNGKVKYDELNPIARATWDAYLKGFNDAIEKIKQHG